MTRCAWLLLLGCVGCQSCTPAVPSTPAVTAAARPTPVADPPPDVSAPESPTPPERLADPAGQADRSLVLAALALDQGHDAEALPHLERYVAHRPDHLLARAQLAEVLFRQQKYAEARLHFELFIALAQEQGEPAFRHLVHSHSRLVEIAEAQRDAYQEHLHRGIGLYLLACRRATEADPDGELSAEALFCRAAAALREARQDRPREARPHWYLFLTWDRLGQRAAALRALADADACALMGRLTPLESRGLQTACLREADALWRTR